MVLVLEGTKAWGLSKVSSKAGGFTGTLYSLIGFFAAVAELCLSRSFISFTSDLLLAIYLSP